VLNAAMVKEVMKLPQIDMILDSLGGSKYYSNFDLITGYLQIALDPETKCKTTVILYDGRMSTFQCMPFSLSFCPNCFSQLMNLALEIDKQRKNTGFNAKRKKKYFSLFG